MKLELLTSTITDYVANGSFSSLRENAKYVSKEEGYARVIRLTDQNDNYSESCAIYVNEESYNFLKKSKLSSGDIIVTNVGAYLGTVFQCPELNIPMTLGPNAILIKPNEDLVINKYLYYLLFSKYGHDKLISLVSGSAMPKFNKTDLKSLDLNIHSLDIQQHIVNTIGSVDDLIENYQKRINRICTILSISLRKYDEKVSIEYYKPKIIKSGIVKFDKTKVYTDTSTIEGINNMSDGEIITFSKRPSRANMQPIKNSVWFAKMKGSNKKLIIADNDFDLINDYILSTGYLGVEASSKLPLSLLSAIIISDDFNEQRDLNSVGTTMAGVNNETFLKILVPKLGDNEIKNYESKYSTLIKELSLLRKKINELKIIKSKLLDKYF